MSDTLEDRIRAAIQWRVTTDTPMDLVRQTGNSAAIVERVIECELVSRYVRVQVYGWDEIIPRLVRCNGPNEFRKCEARLVRFDDEDLTHGESRMIACYEVGEC